MSSQGYQYQHQLKGTETVPEALRRNEMIPSGAGAKEAPYRNMRSKHTIKLSAVHLDFPSWTSRSWGV
jgi:hypothetical protein